MRVGDSDRGGLVGDGNLRLPEYLALVAFLLVSASGQVWRLGRLTLTHRAERPEQRPRT
jgi:hypothetical protein